MHTPVFSVSDVSAKVLITADQKDQNDAAPQTVDPSTSAQNTPNCNEETDLSDVSLDETIPQIHPLPTAYLNLVQDVIDMNIMSPQYNKNSLGVQEEKSLTELINSLDQIKKRLDTFKEHVLQLTQLKTINIGTNTKPTEQDKPVEQVDMFDIPPETNIYSNQEDVNPDEEDGQTKFLGNQRRPILFKRRHPVLAQVIKG